LKYSEEENYEETIGPEMSWKKTEKGELSCRSTYGHREEHCSVANEKKASISKHRFSRQ
jgi:hypothetical protein